MKKSSVFRRVVAFLLAICCFPISVSAENYSEQDLVEPTQYVVTDSPYAQRDLAFGSVCILNGCYSLDSQIPLGGMDRRLETAQSAFVFERSTNTLVYAYNPDATVSPGGLAKLVNALVVVEHANLDDVVTISKSVNRRPSGSVHVELKVDEEITVGDLLHCMIMQGANDAAIALAEFVAGNQEAFVAMMNQRVRQIGCSNTEFGNSHGLDNASQYTTARDMCRIMVDATRNETIRDLLSCISYSVSETNKHAARNFESQNYFIDSKNIQKFIDARITGGLQSYSPAAGANIAFTGKERNMDLVFVVLGAKREFYENGWQVKTYGNFEEGQALFRYVFNSYKANRVLYDGQALKQFAVTGGECNVVAAPDLDIDAVLPADVHMDNLIMEYKDFGLKAPISKGDKIATVEVWYRNTCMMEAELFAMQDVRLAANSGLKVLGGADRADGETTLSRIVLIICVPILILVLGYLAYNNLMRARRRAKNRKRREKGRRKYY